MTLDLTISVVAYHNYSDIINLIRCIIRNTNKNIKKKIYIIDNSCLDANSSNIISFLSKINLYEEIEYINTGGNLGFGRGHNYILDILDSKYHAIVNPDILFYEDVFTKIIEFMSTENIGMCIPKIMGEDGEIHDVYRRELTVGDMFIRMFCPKLFPKRIAYHTMQDMDYSLPFHVPFAQGSFLVIKTNLLKELNGFDDRYFMYLEDADLCKRVNDVSDLIYFPSTYVVHKWERGSHKSIKLFKYHLKSMILYFNKWGYKLF